MSILKNLAKSLYNFALSEDERQSEALVELNTASRSQVTTTFLSREALLLPRNTPEYNRVQEAAQQLVQTHRGATSFNQMCRSYVRRTAGEHYFATVTLGNLLVEVIDRPEGAPVGGEATELLNSIASSLTEASQEKSFVKRRSIVRNAIKAQHPALTTDNLTLAVELVIAIAQEFKPVQ